MTKTDRTHQYNTRRPARQIITRGRERAMKAWNDRYQRQLEFLSGVYELTPGVLEARLVAQVAHQIMRGGSKIPV